ncbi:MFS transporter [Arthrobacter sp. VKM Ac-2550]|uniref:MFS transporter n=1 Tax=Crystallibacter permensis TaxID=1938888 RepID=UPI002227D199|nr:MFS transporter [Arthrobacter sp. VKM Ac-2550]MCW2134529.1 metabolite-proton symporter [Arthrobacter sp. VKM Ac-2550]
MSAEAEVHVSKAELRTVVVSTVIGTTVEWYDFFLYGMAAGLVFDVLFFPSEDPLIGTLLAFGSFAVGFVARPLGGLIFGHIGDKIGRKKTLVTTMIIMGVATFLIGVVPAYGTIGILAPILLVILRLAQGIAVGGEWGGAVLMAVEYAPKGKRGLYGSLPQVGLALGLVLGTGVFALLGAVLSDEAFLSWGWRIAFIMSAVLVGVGLFIRLKVMETPAFRKLQETEAKATIPALELARDRKNRRHILLGMGSRWIEGVAFNTWAVFAIAYGTDLLELSQQTMLIAVMCAAVTMVVFIPVFGRLSDRIDRRHLYTWGSILLGVVAYPAFLLLGTGSALVISATIVVVLGIIYPMVYAPEASLFAELFPIRVRYSGISVVYQLSGIVASGMTPLILTFLLSRSNGSIGPIIGYIAVVCVISAVCTMAIRSRDLYTESVDAATMSAAASGPGRDEVQTDALGSGFGDGAAVGLERNRT